MCLSLVNHFSVYYLIKPLAGKYQVKLQLSVWNIVWTIYEKNNNDYSLFSVYFFFGVVLSVLKVLEFLKCVKKNLHFCLCQY